MISACWCGCCPPAPSTTCVIAGVRRGAGDPRARRARCRWSVCSAGWRSALPLMAFSAGLDGGQGPVRAGAAVRLHADVPVLRHVLPAGHAAGLAAVDRLDLAAVARAARSAGRSSYGSRRAALARRLAPRGTWSCSPSVGWVLARRVFVTRRLRQDERTDRRPSRTAPGRRSARCTRGNARSVVRARAAWRPRAPTGWSCSPASSSRCSTCSSMGLGLGALIGDVETADGHRGVRTPRSSRRRCWRCRR